MPTHSFLLYVEDPIKSAEFYEKLLRAKPVDVSPGFAMFAEAARLDQKLRRTGLVITGEG